MPKMKHKDGGRSIDVGPAQVPVYESQGWEVQQPKTSAQTTTPATDAKTKE